MTESHSHLRTSLMRLLGAASPHGPRAVARLAGAASGAATGAACLGLALLTLAQPAFRDTGPGWLKRLDLAVTFLDREGREIGRRGIRHDESVPLAEMPPRLIEAVLATEDRRFFRHGGVDPIGIGRALLANAAADGVVQGGSTLTQQLAKGVFLSGERTLSRKIREAFLAVWLEWHLSKAEILKLYLDRAYLGGGAFGVEAAAQVYFGKSVRDVALPEAALLAGLLKAPSRYGPILDPEAASIRAAQVLDRMVEAGFIDRPTAQDAKRHPARASSPSPPSDRPDYFLDWAFREVQRLAAEGRLGSDTVLVVETTLDSALQERTAATLANALAHEGARLDVGEAAALVMAPDGAVRSLFGGRDYAASQFDRAVDSLRQPGSAFKPFVYAAALAGTDLRPDSLIEDAPVCLGTWCPANYGGAFAGRLPLSAALARSINTVAVQLSIEIGREAGEWTPSGQARFGRARIAELARSLGISTPLGDSAALPLGVAEVRLSELTAAYAAFANGGFKVEPWAVAAVRSVPGQLLYRHGDKGTADREALPSSLVAAMNAMLTGVVRKGTGRRAALAHRAAAGKTGTTNAYRDAWFVGFTGQLAAGIWFGNDDDRPMRGVTGGTLPAAAWHDIMTFAHRDLPAVPLPGLDGGLRVASAPSSRSGFSEAGFAAAGRHGFEVVTAPGAGFAARR